MKLQGGVVALLSVGLCAMVCCWAPTASASVDGYLILAVSGEIQHLGAAPFFGDYSFGTTFRDISLFPDAGGNVTGYLTLLGDGTVLSNGVTPSVGAMSWPFFGWDIARDISAFPDVLGRGPNGIAGYYLLDGFGGQFAVPVPTGPVPPNFKPYRDKMSPDHYVYFGWDIAKQLETSVRFVPGVNPGDDPIPVVNGYYILDGFGAFHWCLEDPLGNVVPGPWYGQPLAYFGWDIARAVKLTPSARGVYLLDGYGGIHMYGDANRAYSGGGSLPTFGVDIARDIEVVENESGSVTGLYVMTGDGAVFGEGNATVFPGGHVYTKNASPDPDAARDMEINPYYRFISQAVVTGP